MGGLWRSRGLSDKHHGVNYDPLQGRKDRESSRTERVDT